MTTITTPFAGTETRATFESRITAILQEWGGAGVLSGVTTFGGLRTVINTYADAANDINGSEVASSFIGKLNWLNQWANVPLSTLFTGGAQGFWLDPSQISTLTQDSAGTTAVTAAGQPVGRALDLSGRNNHATQSVSAARPTYRVDGGGRPYLEFDGLSDWLTTPSMALAAGGRTIIAAVRKRAGASIAYVAETRPMWTTAAGGIAQAAPGSTGSDTYGSRVNTSTVQSLINSAASFAPPHLAVLSTVIGAGSHVLRANGVSIGSDTPGGTISALTAAMAIGSRDGTSAFASIDLYGLLVIDRALTGADLTHAEVWAAAKAGVTL